MMSDELQLKYKEWCWRHEINVPENMQPFEMACALIEYFANKDYLKFYEYQVIIEYLFQMAQDFSFHRFENKKYESETYADLYLEVVSIAIKYAGDKKELGYAFGGLEAIKQYAKCLPDFVLVKILDCNERLEEGVFRSNIRNYNIYELIMYSAVRETIKYQYMFRYIDALLLGNKIMRRLNSLIQEKYQDYNYYEINDVDNKNNVYLKNTSGGVLSISVNSSLFGIQISVLETTTSGKRKFVFDASIHKDMDSDVIICTMSLRDKNTKINIPMDVKNYEADKYDNYNRLFIKFFEWKSGGNFELIYLYGENIYDLPPQSLTFVERFEVMISSEDGNTKKIVVKERENYTEIPRDFFGEGIKSIHALIGKNGSGKSSIFELICKCNIFGDKDNKRDEFGNYFLIYRIGENFYYTQNMGYEVELQTKVPIQKYNGAMDLKICKISNAFDIYNYERNLEKNFLEQNIIDLTTQTLMNMSDYAFETDCNMIKNYQKTFQRENSINNVDEFDNKIVGENLSNFSSGERARITIFARLLSIFHVEESMKGKLRVRDRSSNYMILLDEAELYFHPAWQRKIILDIRNFLLEINKRYDVFDNIFIIFSSNSPFYMSDLPDCAIHRLNGEQEEKTFGKNIYGLLKTKFFMDKGVMGAFAQEKLDRALHFLASNEKSGDDKILEEIRYLISIVGDPMLEEIMKERMIEKGYEINV